MDFPGSANNASNAFNTTATKLGKDQTASLDESIGEDGSQTRGDTLQSNDLSPEDAAIMKNAKARLAVWLQSLSETDRKIIALTKAGKKFREVSAAVGKSHEFVRQRLAKLQGEALKAMEVSGEFQGANKTPYYLESFTKTVDDIIGETYTGNGSVFVCETPGIFADLGFPRLPIMTTSKHVESIYSPKEKREDHNHDLGELIKQIPEKLKNPLMVIASKTRRDTSIVAILELEDKNEYPIIVPVLLSGRSGLNRIDAHIMTSAYGKKSAFSALAKDAVEDEKKGIPSVLYAQKKAEEILDAEGVQFPDRYVFDSVNHTIHDIGIKVKPQTKTLQFKSWFGDSKVVDENGEPLVVYHGTNWDGWEFDTENGAFFSEKEDYAVEMAAQRGGSRIVKAYLSIRNPLIVKVPGNKMADPAFEARIIAEAKSKGHDGVKLETDTDNEIAKDVFWVAFEPNQIKSATDNIGTFDPNNPDIRYQGEDVHRGVTWQDPVSLKTIITLFEKADSSTLIHEIAHYCFNSMEEAIRLGVADQRMIDDFNTLKKWAESNPESKVNSAIRKLRKESKDAPRNYKKFFDRLEKDEKKTKAELLALVQAMNEGTLPDRELTRSEQFILQYVATEKLCYD